MKAAREQWFRRFLTPSVQISVPFACFKYNNQACKRKVLHLQSSSLIFLLIATIWSFKNHYRTELRRSCCMRQEGCWSLKSALSFRAITTTLLSVSELKSRIFQADYEPRQKRVGVGGGRISGRVLCRRGCYMRLSAGLFSPTPPSHLLLFKSAKKKRNLRQGWWRKRRRGGLRKEREVQKRPRRGAEEL